MKYDDYIIREIKGWYYVYKPGNMNYEIRETYVGSLIDVIKTYLKLKVGVLGDTPNPTTPGVGFEPTQG
ncbi:putative integrase [Sulfolobus acidocaldarius]|uniref:putative integrase n=1 Tax=Sulfolobus acidocaldarius TaxID=2285 RepID=UPI00214F2280|nr:putative integrase [Sulfolobus acidocaldarius]